MSKLELSLIDYADYTNVNDISNSLLRNIRKQSLNNQVPIPVPIHDKYQLKSKHVFITKTL